MQKLGIEVALGKKTQQLGKKEAVEYKERCMKASFYPFTLVFMDKQVEVVATDPLQFKFLTEAFEELRK